MSIGNDKASVAIRETASEWAARLAAADFTHADKLAFVAWLRASPVHVREYLNAEALRFMVGQAVQDDATDVRELLKESPSNVIEWEAPPPPRVKRRVWRLRPPLFIASAATLLVCVMGALFAVGALSRDAYSTSVGEIRRIALSDGSIVELNTRSKIRVDFAEGRRDIHLTQGEAFFTVAKDRLRPFRVQSGPALIRAIGTQFSVYRRAGDTVVTVVEGKVAAESQHKTLELTAGHQAVIDSSSRKHASGVAAMRVDAVRATSWRQYRLIFDNQPLSQVIAEFNRYNSRQLVIDDPQLGSEGISGVFDPDKPQALLLFLHKKGGVQATELAGDRIVLSR